MAIDYEYLSDERLIQLSEEEFDSEAMYELATRYRKRQNYEKEIEYLNMCAHNLNDVTFAEEAQFILGCYYYNSYHDVIEKNVNKAINCFELSGYHYAPANWFLARHFEHQGYYMQAFNYLTKAKSMDPPMEEMPIEFMQEANAFESPEDWYENKIHFLFEKSSEKRKEVEDEKKREREAEAIRKKEEEDRRNRRKILRDPTFNIVGIIASIAFYFLPKVFATNNARGFMFLIKELGGVCGTFITGFISCYLLFDTLFLGLGFIGGIFGVVGSFLIISLIKSYPIVYTIVKYYSIVAVALLALNIIYKQIKYK